VQEGVEDIDTGGNKMECWNYPKIGDDEDGDDGDY